MPDDKARRNYQPHKLDKKSRRRPEHKAMPLKRKHARKNIARPELAKKNYVDMSINELRRIVRAQEEKLNLLKDYLKKRELWEETKKRHQKRKREQMKPKLKKKNKPDKRGKRNVPRVRKADTQSSDMRMDFIIF
jgi:predicted DNA-binding protein YlxM (UPF0122 family)